MAREATQHEGRRTPGWLRLAMRLMAALQTQDEHVGLVSRVARSACLVPIFGCVLIALRLRSMFGSPVVIEVSVLNGARIICALPDLVQMYIAFFGTWEPDLRAHIERTLSEGDVVVDVGANVGFDSLLAAQLVGESGHVIAVEASPSIADALEHNVRRSNAGNVEIRRCAASSTRGTITVYLGPAHNRGLTTTVQGRGQQAEQEVEALPLTDIVDSEMRPRVRMIKIDVEGGEPDVLIGARALLPECHEDVQLLVELSPNWWADTTLTPQKVLQPLLDDGFHVYTIENNYWPWRYLWPRAAKRAVRYRGSLDERVKRLDVILSRRDADAL